MFTLLILNKRKLRLKVVSQLILVEELVPLKVKATVTPGPWHIHRMLEAEELPINVGFTGKGQAVNHTALIEQIHAGVIGLKVHEDWGATPSALSHALDVADEFDIQIALHADTLNEAGFMEDTMEAVKGRVLQCITEGAGGGHAPDLIKSASYPNIPVIYEPLPYTKYCR